MILIQLYKVVNYIDGKYVVDLYSSVYDIKPVRLHINRWKFRDWIKGKIDKSELEGDKIQLHKIRDKKSNTIKNTLPIITITDKEKDIMDIVKDIVNKNTYAIEKDIVIEGYSKALIQRTVTNKDILDLYSLERVRANKEIKEEMGIDIKGYPYILCRK